jgi:uncharacterized protein
LAFCARWIRQVILSSPPNSLGVPHIGLDTHTALITALYTALQRRDGDAMADCYAATATFEDPVFHLEGGQIGEMWRMLCERGTDLRVDFHDVVASGGRGHARWEAWYTFTATRRPVHNRIRAEFEFCNDRISRHVDRFSLYRWAHQALGLRGTLLGWAPPVQQQIRAQAALALAAYSRRVESGRGAGLPDRPETR